MRINYILDAQDIPTGKLYKWCIWGLVFGSFIVHVLKAWGLLNGHSFQCLLTMPEVHERVMTADGQTLGAEILNWASQISRHLPGNQHEFPQYVARLEGTHGRGGVTMCANKKTKKTCIIKSQVNSVNSVHCTPVCLRVSCLFLLQEYAGKVRSLWRSNSNMIPSFAMR